MQRRRLGLLVGTLVAGAALVIAGAAGAGKPSGQPQPKVGGTLVFGAEQETAGLNPALSCCSFFWNSVMVWTTTIRGAFLQQPDFSFKEDMVTKVDVKTKPQMVLRYHIKPEAKWSDGRPITADDFIFTAQTYNNKKWDIGDRSGYDQIRSLKKIAAKTVEVTMKKPFAAWKPVLFAYVFPRHALQGEDFNKTWIDNLNNPKTGKPIASGPFVFKSWTKGQQLVIERNPNWWGPHKAYLNRVVFRFITDTNSEIQAIRGGEVDVIYPQPQLALADLAKQSGIKVQSRAGVQLEHIDYQMGKNAGPLETAPWVRQAIAYAVDRAATVRQLFRTLSPKLPVLESLIYVSNQKEYVPHFQRYKYDPNKVAQLMQAHGCTKGGDGIFVCQGQRMSYKFTSTAGNKLRELAFEIMQAQARRAGIELVSAFGPARIVFGPTVFEAGNFELFMYAWVGNGDPQGWLAIYNCGGDSNFKGYCSRKVTKLLNDSQFELDPEKRAALANEADRLMANGLPALPLYQKPTYLVYKDKVKGVVDNPTNQGPTWNFQDVWIG